MKHIFLCLFFAMLLGCSSDISKEIQKMKSCNMDLSIIEQSGAKCNNEFKLIVYYDSTQCSTCAINSLWEYEELLETCNNLDLFVILYPSSRNNVDMLNSMLSKISPQVNTILDFDGTFEKKNPQIPSNELFHTFLIDKKGTVLLVGDPLKNKKIRGLLYNILNKKMK